MRSASLRCLLLALPLVALGLALRTYGLPERGIFLYDEGVCVGEGRYLAGVVRAIPDALKYAWRVRADPQDPECAVLRERLASHVATGSYPIWGKYTHGVLIAGLLLLTGDAAWAPNAESALFGALTVLLLWLTARRMFGDAAALLGALFLALCPLHILFSRGALAETDSSFFLLAGVALTWLALNGARRPLPLLFAAGAAAGLSFTANVRLALAAPTVIAVFALSLAAPGRPLAGERLRGFVWLCAGMAAPVLAWELLFRLALWLLQQDLGGPAPTYFERLSFYLFGEAVGGAGSGDARSLPYLLGFYGAWPFLLAAGLGCVRDLRARRCDAVCYAVPLLFAFLFFQTRHEQQCVRYLSLTLPFLGLALAGALRPARPGPAAAPGDAEATGVSRGRALVLGGAAVLVIAASLAQPQQWLRDRSGLREAFGWLRAQREARQCAGYLCPEVGLGIAYDPVGAWDDAPPAFEEGLKARVRAGVRYVVVTPLMLTCFPMPPYWRPLVEKLHAACPPTEFEHPAGALPYLSHEHNLFQSASLDDTLANIERLESWGNRVRIYDLALYYGFVKSPAPGGRPR